MNDLVQHIPPTVMQHLATHEQDYLRGVFERFSGYPSLEQVWQLMDEPWVELGCDPENLDERVTAYYRHPVWVLNGLFIEQHAQSLAHRQAFTDWVSTQKPQRLADFGGGFGGLARLIGQALPGSQVEVIDPHPHPAAIALAANTPNVRFMPELTSTYDMLIATDVFEHVPDPIALAADTAAHLRVGGQFLIANCFQPVILCHLPQLFHFHVAWDPAMKAMGLVPGARVQYGRAYQRMGNFNIPAARAVAQCAHKLQPWISRLPKGKTTVGKALLRWLCPRETL